MGGEPDNPNTFRLRDGTTGLRIHTASVTASNGRRLRADAAHLVLL